MLVKTYGSAVLGIDATPITLEISSTPGVDFVLVGLPDNAVKESHERIATALRVSDLHFPRKSLVINMAPADIKKEGAAYDLPLAVGMLASDEQIPSAHLGEYMIMGELSLDGSLRPIRGVLPMALCARREHFRGIILPVDNACEAAVVDGLDVIAVRDLTEVVAFLSDQLTIEPMRVDTASELEQHSYPEDIDFSDVKGQENVKRALEVAAAGGHNLIMVGPPGAGKSMMAKRLPTILPPLSLDEALETTKIHSVAGLMQRRTTALGGSLITQRPFRSPHHTITDVALIGGGSNPQPGEISLATNGVLFLDELPEYKRTALEVMRQPLEDRKIRVSRAKISVEYPASFMLVAAMNPCPCGHYGDPNHACTCSPAMVHRYLGKISGPLLDRIDIHVDIQAVPIDQLQSNQPSESSAAIRERVLRARAVQKERFAAESGVYCNAQMSSRMLRQYCVLTPEVQEELMFFMQRLNLSARAYDRILKVSRTIADLAGSADIELRHVQEAIGYRTLDREGWGG